VGYENIDLEINYNDLIKELVEGIPHLSAKWTDHNASDFGIMILELYAFIADNYLYKINQVEDDVLIGFLKNYVLSASNHMANSQDNADVTLKNTDLKDGNDYALKDLEDLLKNNPVADEANLKKIRRFFSEPYRLITKDDVITICKSFVSTMKAPQSGAPCSLKGIVVTHDKEKYSFDIVVSVESTDSNKPLVEQEKPDIAENIKKALLPRKLLGSQLAVTYAKEAKVDSVDVLLKFNTKTSEWNRDADQLVKDRVLEYFKTTARGDDLSIHQVVSLFEMYSFLEELEIIDYVEKINISIDGTIYSDDPLNYKVMFEIFGEILPPPNNQIKISKVPL
jgi:hypothetical protein